MSSYLAPSDHTADPAPEVARSRHGADRSRVVFLVRSLEIGGAERQLVILARALHRQGVPVAVLSCYEGGELSRYLSESGIPVRSLGKKGRWDVLSFLPRLASAVRSEQPAILHSYLNISNILGLLVKPLVPQAEIVWGVRASNVDLSPQDWLSRLASRLEARLARYADRVIVNSWAGRAFAIARGFPEGKLTVVPNGIDTEQFRFDGDARSRLRREWQIADADCAIGLPARFNPVKDHPTFLRAASRLANKRPHTRFVCVGDGPVAYRRQLQDMARKLGIDRMLVWTGMQRDMRAAYSAFDITCSCSSSEGFSNVIGEAMACERTCVVTDVGDSARIVGDTGLVVPPGDPVALADAWERQASLSPEVRRGLGIAARARIEAEYSVSQLVENTCAALGLA